MATRRGVPCGEAASPERSPPHPHPAPLVSIHRNAPVPVMTSLSAIGTHAVLGLCPAADAQVGSDPRWLLPWVAADGAMVGRAACPMRCMRQVTTGMGSPLLAPAVMGLQLVPKEEHSPERGVDRSNTKRPCSNGNTMSHRAALAPPKRRVACPATGCAHDHGWAKHFRTVERHRPPNSPDTSTTWVDKAHACQSVRLLQHHAAGVYGCGPGVALELRADTS